MARVIIAGFLIGMENWLPQADHDFDEDIAERAVELMNELNVDEDDAVALAKNR